METRWVALQQKEFIGPKCPGGIIVSGLIFRVPSGHSNVKSQWKQGGSHCSCRCGDSEEFRSPKCPGGIMD